MGNLRDDQARVQMSDVRRHLDDTYFAWIGGSEPDSVFYYRIHSPVILIEFDHQRPANLRHLAKDPTAPNLEHIHTVVRTPNGNDYGKDLLRQHYAAHAHPHARLTRRRVPAGRSEVDPDSPAHGQPAQVQGGLGRVRARHEPDARAAVAGRDPERRSAWSSRSGSRAGRRR